MRFQRGVEKVRILAENCERAKRWPPDGPPFLWEAYVFGEILTGADPIKCVEVAFMLDLSPEDVPWGSEPPGSSWLVSDLRLDKGGFAYWWRSRHEPVWNGHIRTAVRFWSLEGTDEAALEALRERRFADLPSVTASVEEIGRRTSAELERALARLRAVQQDYWDRDWRREHRGGGRYPEHYLWEATYGYLDLLDATSRSGDESGGR